MAKLRKGAGWLAGVGLMSAAVLGLEIALTNVFGVLLQYHYVSFIVSLAVFGIGAGAYASYRSKPSKSHAGVAGWVCTATGVFMALLSIALAKFPYVGQIVIYSLICIVPFLLFGWVTGRALRSGASPVTAVYAADLLGAGLGAAGTYLLLERVGGLAAVCVLSVLCFAAAVALFAVPQETTDRRRITGRPAGIAAAVFLLVAVLIGVGRGTDGEPWRVDFAGMKGAPPDKTIVGSLKADPHARVIRTDWDSFARTDTVRTSDENRRILFVDGGAGSYMYKFDGNLNSAAHLAKDIEFLPFAAGPASKTIIVGAGGGRDILYALLAGAKDVTAVELSPGLVKSVRADAAYNGSILDRPDVRTVVGDGRSILERSRESYDLIVLDLVYSQVGGMGGQTLAENYVFTREAFAAYLKRLSPNGRIIVISHQGIEGIRAYYTGFEALLSDNGRKPEEAARHTALLMAPADSASPNLTVSVIQKSPLGLQQLQLLQAGTRSLGLNALFLPGSNERLLKPLLEQKVPFDQFVRDSDFNVYPTTDDKPFFFQLDPKLPAPLKQWLAVIAALSVIFGVYVWRRETAQRAAPAYRVSPRASFGTLSFYVLTGVGYMCVQTVWIQKTMIYAGSPVIAAMVVIVAMLLGGSVGSFVAGRFQTPIHRAILAFLILAAGVTALEQWLGGSLLLLGSVPRLTFIGVAVFVVSILLGIALPAGLSADERRMPGLSPFFFAVNGIAGIWGSWLAITVSLTTGLTATLTVGCLCYAVIALIRYQQYRRIQS